MLSYLKDKGDAVLTGGDSGGGWFTGRKPGDPGLLVGINSFTFNLTDFDGLASTPPQYGDFGFGSRNASGYNYDNGDGTGSQGTGEQG